MEIIQTIFAFIITISILVSIHEWGHFWVARRVGVKVLRFSIGFGKPLLCWHDKHGTEFCISIIPLGGYVKMLDEREGEVALEELDKTFNRRPLLARILVVAAGPCANFVLAIIALWLMYLIGVTSVVPVVGKITPGFPAADAGMQSGEVIQSVDGNRVHSWNDFNLLIAGRIGDKEVIDITAHTTDGHIKNYRLFVSHWPENLERHTLLDVLGISVWVPIPSSVIGRVLKGLPAEKGGLQAGDRVVAVNDNAVHLWTDLVANIADNDDPHVLQIDVSRDGKIAHFTVVPEKKTLKNGKIINFIGIEAQPVSWPKKLIHTIQYNAWTAFLTSVSETWKLSYITLKSLFNIIGGVLSVQNLSGPITIAKVASQSLYAGFESFLYFIAMISVSLGVINLLPIPALDGGHLFYFLIEAIRGKPLSERIQHLGLRIGIVFILCVMILALYNDFVRLLQ